MADFKTYLPKLLQYEGGYSNNPNDKGGATNKGITLATFRSFYGPTKTVDDLKRITDEQVEHIYKVGYWDKWKADNIASQKIAEMLVDWGVNAGPAKIIKKVQGMIGTDADGVVGPKTLYAINRMAETIFLIKLTNARLSYYLSIVDSNSSQQIFIRGWAKRTIGFCNL